MSIDLSQFHQVFFEESFEGLDAMETALMELDPADVDSETINTIFRAAHSIKGGSATFGFSIVADFTHVLETLLDEIRSESRGISQDDVDLFLQSVDCLRELLTSLQADEEPDPEQSEALKAAFEAILRGESPDLGGTGDAPVDEAVVPEVQAQQSQEAQLQDDQSQEESSEQSGGKLWRIRFVPGKDILRTGNEPLRMFRELADLGDISVSAEVDQVPEFIHMEPETSYLGWQILYTGDATREQLEEVFEWVVDESLLEITEADAGSIADAAALASSESSGWHIHFKPSTDVLRTGNEPLRIFRELADYAPVTAKADVSGVPTWTEYDSESCYLAWDLNLGEAATKEQIDEAFEWVVDESDLVITSAQQEDSSAAPDQGQTTGAVTEEANQQVSAAETAPPPVESVATQVPEVAPAAPAEQAVVTDTAVAQVTASAVATDQTVTEQSAAGGAPEAKPKAAKPAKAAKKSSASESSSIRVGIDKIDSLINMVGELVITQSMLGQLGSDFEMGSLPKLLEGLGQLEQNTRELQESVMRIRMLPISFAFSRFPRMVRDLSRRLGKNIDLVLLGEQTELDKTVMEKIGDPLVHLVRNSVDHGIEMPDERQAAGKSEFGEIVLNAYHQGGNVVIEITDDGKGLNRERLLNKAIENGLVLEKDAPLMSDEQVHDLIFQPGFSTAKEVSDVSGRGVGMDVVRRNIQELNGSIEISSKEGEGSRITIRLPLTLAILDGQLVRVGSDTYIFPLVSIVESLQIEREMMSNVAGGCDVFKLRDEYVPIIRLFDIFGIQPDTHNIDESLLVVVECDGEKVGIVVDELEAQQQVVIKSLEQNYKRVEGVSGATILGDGTVALILDIPGLVKLAGVNHQVRSRVMSLAGSHDSVQQIA